MAAIALKREDSFGVFVGLIESKATEVECFNLHRIANKLVWFLNFDDGVIGCHVVKDWQVVRLFIDVIDHVLSHFLGIDDLSVKLAIPGGHGAVEVHEVLSEGASLVEASEFNHSSSNHLILRDAENRLLLQFFNGIDDSESHADGESGRHCDENHIDEF